MLHAPRSANVARLGVGLPAPSIVQWDSNNRAPGAEVFINPVAAGATAFVVWQNDGHSGRNILSVTGLNPTVPWARVIRHAGARLTEMWSCEGCAGGDTSFTVTYEGGVAQATTFIGELTPSTFAQSGIWSTGATGGTVLHADPGLTHGACLALAFTRWGLDPGAVTPAPEFTQAPTRGRTNRDYAQYQEAESLSAEQALTTHTTQRNNKQGTLILFEGV